MTEAKNQQAEPSMEEILASIRRIISEDTDAGKAATPAAPAAAPSPATPPPAAAAAPPPPPPPPQPAPAPVADVLELTEMVGDDGKVTEIAEEKNPAPPPVAPTTDEEDRLVSNRAASAAAGALAGLAAASRKPEGTDMRGLMGVGNGAMTLEEIVRSEMRPILKAWLDENLPPLVERLVQKEIKRITRQVDET